MRLTKSVYVTPSGSKQHHWRVEMHGSKGVLSAMVGVTDQLMMNDRAAARSDVARGLIEARRDIRKAYETTSPPWASSR